MKKRLCLLVLLCLTLSHLDAATWIEDSLSFAFEYPRGWAKSVLRHPDTVRIQFSKTNREAILQVDVARRTKDYDIDRFIEETVDTFLTKYPDLKLVREKMLENEVAGFDESVFVVLHYTEHKQIVSNRFLFHRKGGLYYVIQAKTPRAFFAKYSKDLDLVMKSFRRETRTKNRWRNDSLAYLDPIKDERIIQYISITIRPIDSYPHEHGVVNKQDEEWLFSVEGNKKPGTGEWDNRTKPSPNDSGYTPADVKPDTPTSDEPVVIPDNSGL
ncbi:hypothetical protein JWG40_00580 [Leptospira sp. 201903074]|uniref:hypothetical protein n=1 Tax=Leptospira abararensis TaxID=2810036 RepID=UPI001962E7A7|nr:hypothetical protein [Leptospira abararensis]MBM9545495.1 hypothetical protein [Leptospira abararensis]